MILPTRRATCADDPRNWPAARELLPHIQRSGRNARQSISLDEWRYYRRAVSTAAVARRRDDAAAD